MYRPNLFLTLSQMLKYKVLVRPCSLHPVCWGFTHIILVERVWSSWLSYQLPSSYLLPSNFLYPIALLLSFRLFLDVLMVIAKCVPPLLTRHHYTGFSTQSCSCAVQAQYSCVNRFLHCFILFIHVRDSPSMYFLLTVTLMRSRGEHRHISSCF